MTDFPYEDFVARADRAMWSEMIAGDRRRPTELLEMPTQGKVVVAANCRWQAAVRMAAEEGLDYFLNDLVPSSKVFVMDTSPLASLVDLDGLFPDRFRL